MRIKEIKEFLEAGYQPQIRFTRAANSIPRDVAPDPGMRGILLDSYVEDERNGVWYFSVDLSQWEEHNRKVATHNWFNPATGSYDLNIFEANRYPANGVMSFTSAINPDTGEVEIFELVPESSLALFREYAERGAGVGYTAWLEAQVMSLRGTAAAAEPLLEGMAVPVSLQELFTVTPGDVTAYGYSLVRNEEEETVDLIGRNGELLCCDGEECVVVDVADNAIVLRALGTEHSFILSRNEEKVAIFQ
jgi:hypothetical protein